MSIQKSSDFTHARYIELLQIAKNNFQFISFDEVIPSSRFILWRHDIDFSVHAAEKLASIESSLGVKSTYFVHLHSEFYNCFESVITTLLKRIAALGHDIGLHFDVHYYDISTETDLEKYLTKEKTLLDDLIECDVKVFSFHNTSPFTMSCEKERYAGLINTYAARFKNELGYCSDSNGYWRFENLYNVLHNNTQQGLQILTHPAWWTEKAMSPRDKVVRCAYGRAEQQVLRYDNALEQFGRQNIREIV